MPVDPSAIRTWANAVTVGRLLISPLMFAIIPTDNAGGWMVTGLWFLLCLSDLVDGQLARRHGTTRSGAFLDPLADKVSVLGAMFVLVSRGMFNPWLVGLIAAREIAISLYRVFAGAKGVSVPASKAAKFKTFAQQLAVGFAVLPWSAANYNYLAKGSLAIATALTLYSGMQYAAVALTSRRQA